EWWGGFDADEVNAVDAARRIRAPLFLMADGGDPRMPASVVRRIYDAHTGSKRFWGVPDAPHLGASLHAEFWPRIETFLTDNGL
ncbi:MAG: hypothetical protein MUF51_10445, partial [Vicinamibacteria bacterium]|nr:hypothetical protein [Vicinamibacteria bacterium]